MEKLISKQEVSLLKKALKDIPKDEWVCGECNSKNNTWFPDMEHLQKCGVIKYNHGICHRCMEKKNNEQREYDITIKKQLKKEKIQEILKASKMPAKVANSRFSNLEIREGAEIAFDTMKNLKSDKIGRAHV